MAAAGIDTLHLVAPWGFCPAVDRLGVEAALGRGQLGRERADTPTLNLRPTD